MPVQMHLTLEKGEMHMDGSRLTVIGPAGAVFEEYSTLPQVGKDYWGNSHEHLIKDFYDRLQAGKPPFVTARDALETTRIMDQAYHCSAEIRKRPQ